MAQWVKNPPVMQETQIQSLGLENPLEEEMATPPVFLPGEFHGWATVHRIIESDMTEGLTHTAAAAKSLQLCPTLCDPIGGSPPGSPPWNSPGKNTGVGCHFLLQCMKVKSESEVPQSCPTLSNPMDCSPPGSSVHGIFQARV